MRKSRSRNKRWIQKAVERPNRVRKYLSKVYGKKAFNEDGTMKLKYLRMAKKRAARKGNTSLVRAINLAMILRKLSGKKTRGKKR